MRCWVGADNEQAVKRVRCAMQVYYVVDKPTSFFWRGGKGYITEDTVRKHLPAPSDDNLILVRDPSTECNSCSTVSSQVPVSQMLWYPSSDRTVRSLTKQNSPCS
jgi:NAD(P)H-flavin reductase